MIEITPDMIASIATRLYNEIPGANMVPKTESDLSHGIPEAGGMPGVPSQFTAGAFSLPTAAEGISIPGLSSGMPNVAGIPTSPNVSPDGFQLPGLSGLSHSWPGSTGGAGSSAESFSIPGAAGVGSHGYPPDQSMGIKH